MWRFLKELKIHLPYDPAIALLGIDPKDTDAVKRQDTCTPMFLAAKSTIAKLWKEPRCPWTDDGQRSCGLCVRWDIPQPSESSGTALRVMWMELEDIMLSKYVRERQRTL